MISPHHIYFDMQYLYYFSVQDISWSPLIESFIHALLEVYSFFFWRVFPGFLIAYEDFPN